MKAIVFADRRGTRLGSLTDNTCVALLRVGGKHVIEHALEALAGTGVSEVIVVAPAEHLEAVEAVVAAGSLLGVPVECVPSSWGESPDAAVARLQPRFDDELLVMRGDVLRSACIADFLARSAAFPGLFSLAAMIGGRPAGLRLVRPGSPLPLGLPRDPDGDWQEGPPRIELPGAALALFESAVAYYRTQVDVWAGRFPGLRLRGRHAMPAGCPHSDSCGSWPRAAEGRAAFFGSVAFARPLA